MDVCGEGEGVARGAAGGAAVGTSAEAGTEFLVEDVGVKGALVELVVDLRG